MASFWVSHPEKERYTLWMSKDIIENFAKKLKLYRLRSKLEIELLEDHLMICGEHSPAPFLPTNTASCALPEATLAGTVYYRRLTQQDIQSSVTTDSIWALLEVMSAIPRITAATQDRFVPQMINFESIGGIDFKKGCYPGQEIVARSQYLGTIKRRLHIAMLDIPQDSTFTVTEGMEVFSENDREQACGLVVLVAKDSVKHQFVFQLELKLAEASARLFFNQPDAQGLGPLKISPPPYPFITI